MLDFILRRTSKSASSSASETQPDAQSPKPNESAKALAMTLADELASDEAGAVAFILSCGFADARLSAAQHIHSKPLLEQVLQAMRKTDRRVAKLMQARLDDIRNQELTDKLAQDCLDEAQRLLQDMPLMANRVADLDRRWQSAGAVSASRQASFAEVRGQIAQRLTAQATLQRSAIDLLDRVRKLNAETSPTAEASESFEIELAQLRSSSEVAALPPHLLTELEQECLRLKNRQSALARNSAALNLRNDALAVWEIADPATLESATLKRAWEEMPMLDDQQLFAPLEHRFEALLQKLASHRQAQMGQYSAKDFSELLAALEQALREGLLHVAVEKNEVLHSLDLSARQPDKHQLARLADARAELKRLQSWARWSGNVSREELVEAVTKLVGQSLRINDLAKMISVARQQWKALDVASGAAPKTLWERFDVACNAAYAPVAEHAKQQSQERRQNRDAAEKLLAEMRQFIEAAGLNAETTAETAAPNWKDIANHYRNARQAWQKLGTIDRKDRKRLNAEFDGVLQRLLKPLREQWRQEIARRESLIVEAEALNPADRHSLERIRQLQAQWQESARSIPLERHDEQDLWRRFHSACDAVFVHRREKENAADAERKRHQQEKEALCVALETAQEQSEGPLHKLLRETAVAWARVGAVPKAGERQLEQRYRHAVAALQARVNAAKNAEREAEFRALLEKLSLCQAAEAAVSANHALDAGWAAHWQMLPPLSPKWETLMRARFDAAHAALQSGDRQYADGLESARAVLAQELLRLEILAGIPSPAELSAQRLQMQVTVLQSVLSGQQNDSLAPQVERLCGLAALADEQAAIRLRQLLEKVWLA